MKSVFELDLDTSKFTKGISEAGELMQKIGEHNGIINLVESVETLGKGFLALKAIGLVKELVEFGIEAALDAEHVNAISNAFKTLSEEAGIVPEELKEGLEKVADGLIEGTQLLEIANKAIVSMGKGAEHLPEIFEQARKAATAFGGAATDRFEQINQAIQSGQTRMLKQIGINIDADQAMKDYARTLGVTSDQLNEQGKQTAIMNAFLEQSREKYKGIDVNAQEMGNALARTKTSFGELGESSKIFFNVLFGPAIEWAIEKMGEFAGWINKFVKKFIDLTPHVKAHVEVQKEMTEEMRKQQELEANTKAADPKEKLAAQKAYYSELNKLKSEFNQAEMQSARDMDVWDKAQKDQRKQMEQQYLDERAIKQKELDENRLISTNQRNELLAQMEQTHQQKMLQYDLEAENRRKQANSRIIDDNARTQNTFSAGWNKAAKDASKDITAFGMLGKASFDALGKNSKKAFIAMGDGSKTAGEAMKGFMFGALADIAEQEGEFLLIKGIATLDPASAAGGAALLALSGYLRSQAGGGGGGGGGGSSYSGGGGGDIGGGSSDSTKPEQKEAAKKSVTLQVMGNIYETDDTKQRLVQLIREATDATDFKYQQIGVS